MARALAAAVAVALLGACGAAGSTSGPGAANPTPTAVLTEADGGKSVQLHVGDRAALRLTSTYVWTSPTSSGGAVRVTPVEGAGDPTFREWTIEAVARGTATVTAEGRPTCSPGTMCTQVIRDLAITVVVT